MTLHIQATQAVLGAEISGLDLRQPVSAADRAELNALLAQHAVLIFRQQPLSPPQFMQAAEIFGSLVPQQIKKFVLPDYPLVGFNSTVDLPRKNGKLQVRGENFHTDHSNDLAPPKATALVAVQLPAQGGDTQFVDVRRAYADLPEAMKQRINGLRSLHIHESSRSPRSFAKLTAEQMAAIPRTAQPLVIRHPVSGMPALYLNTGRMEGVLGLADDEGFALIDALYQHATQPRYEYRHPWRVGDLVIWDNRATMHRVRRYDDLNTVRDLRRTTTKSDGPTVAQVAA